MLQYCERSELLHSVWILAYSTNFCPIKTDLSGNTVWPQASDLQKLVKMDNFGHFLFTFVTKWDFLKIFTYNALHMIFLPIFYQFNGLVNWSYLIYDFPILLFFQTICNSLFLGQIYKTKSSSGMSSSSSSKKQRRCTSQKVTTSTSSSRNHVLESSTEDFTLNSDSAKNLSTQVILEN